MKAKYKPIGKFYDKDAKKKLASVPIKFDRLNELKRAEEFLKKIAIMGFGMKDEVRDWQNIGRNAVLTAREGLAGKCEACAWNKERWVDDLVSGTKKAQKYLKSIKKQRER